MQPSNLAKYFLSHFLLAIGLLSPIATFAATPTRIDLAVNPAQAAPAGSVITLTAAVSASGTTVNSGLVVFCTQNAPRCADVNVLGQSQITSAGVATLKTRLGPGVYTLKAVFSGTSTYARSGSALHSFTVTGKDVSSTSLLISNESETFTSTVTSHGIFPPTGTVVFKDVADQQNPFAFALLGGASLSFSDVPYVPPFTEPFSGAMGDFNQDGIPDMAYTDYSDVVYILLGNGDGTFTEKSKITQVSATFINAVAGFNNDGLPDLALGVDDHPTILLGNGDGTFSVGSTLPAHYLLSTVGDYNGDGNADLVGVDDLGNIIILLGNGNGTFVAKPAFSVGTNTNPGPVLTGDFNGDGIADLAFVNKGDKTLQILLGKGDGTFSTKSTFNVAINDPTTVIAADFNADGVTDLAVAGYSTQFGTVTNIFLGKGDGTFNFRFPPSRLAGTGR